MKKRFDRRMAAMVIALTCLALAFAVPAGMPSVRHVLPAQTSGDVVPATDSASKGAASADPQQKDVAQREQSAGDTHVAPEQGAANESSTDGEPVFATDSADDTAGRSAKGKAKDEGAGASIASETSISKADDETIAVSADEVVSDAKEDAQTFVMPEEAEYEPEEVLLSVNPSASVEDVEALLASTPGIAPQTINAADLSTGLLSVKLEPGTSVEDGVNAVLGMGSDMVTGSQPNYVYYPDEGLGEADLLARLDSANDASLEVESVQAPEPEVTLTEEGGAATSDSAEPAEVVAEAADGAATEATEHEENGEFAAVDPAAGQETQDEVAAADAGNTQGVEQGEAEQTATLQEQLSIAINDRLAKQQWALTSTRAYEAWALATCQGATSVAVLDSGFDLTQEDLLDNIVPGSAYNAYAASIGEGDTDNVLPGVDDAGKLLPHGTRVAGVIGAVANNDKGIAGMSYNAGIVPIRVGNDKGSITTLAVGRAYDYLSDHASEWGVRVINCSFGIAGTAEIIEDNVFSCRAREAFERGIVTVASAGNGGKNSDGEAIALPCYHYPSDSRYVVGVIALQGSASSAGNDASGTYTVSRGIWTEPSASNYNTPDQGGADTREGKNISAPGTRLATTSPGNSYHYATGTSMASPVISGVLALEFAAKPNLSADEAVDILYASAHDIGDEGWDAEFGHGEVNAAAAVRMAKTGGLATTLDDGSTVVVRLATPDAVHEYDGTAQEPEVEVTLIDAEGSQTQLVRDADFLVAYANNTNAGDATITVTGTGAYEGKFSRNLHFTIAGRALTQDMVSLKRTTWTYDASPIRPNIAVAVKEGIDADGQASVVTLTKGTDYSTSYSFENNENAGTGTAHYTVYGMGNYTGHVSVGLEFTIEPRSINDDSVAAEIGQATYNGKAQKPSVTLSYERATAVDGERIYALVANTDYTLSYASNVNAGEATVEVTGAGNFTGKRNLSFQIEPATLADEEIRLDAESYQWKEGGVTPEATVAHEGRQLVKGTDYTISYVDNTEIGTAKVVIMGIGNYQGTVNVSFAIVTGFLDDAMVSIADAHTYNGSAIEPKPTVTLDGKNLTEGVDYTVSYEGNVKAGKATVTLTGTGTYGGTKAANFNIAPADIADVAVSSIRNKTYTGKVITQDLALHLGNYALTADDYSVAYENNVNAGTARLVVTPKGSNFTGKARAIEFRITPRQLSDATIAAVGTFTYDGTEHRPTPAVSVEGKKLVASRDFVYAYEGNVDAGTATFTVTGRGNYAGTARGTFQIARTKVAAPTATNRTYNGKAQTGVAAGAGYALSGTVSATNAGTYTATATLDANHCWQDGTTGAKSIRWTVAKAAQPMKLKAVKRTAKASATKKKAITVAAPLKFTKKAQGTATYARVAKGSAKCLTVNKKTGKVTIKKGTKKGTYKIKIKVTAKGNKNYKSGSKTITCTVVVK